MQGIFFNEMYSLEMDSGKWHEVLLRYFFLEGLGEVGWFINGGWESHLSGCFRLFGPKFWKVAGTYKCCFCHYFTAGWVVWILKTWCRTQTLPAVIERIWMFSTHRWWGCKNMSVACLRQSLLVKMSLFYSILTANHHMIGYCILWQNNCQSRGQRYYRW